MYVLGVAVVVLAVLVLLDLSLTAAVIRRLRVLSERVSAPGVGGLSVGSEVPEFEAEAADGGPVTHGVFSGRRTLVAFYATGCQACQQQAPEFAAEASKLDGQGVQVLPVLMVNGADPGDEQEKRLRAVLAGAGRLVVDGEAALPKAFAVQSTPSYFAVGPDGRVTGKGMRVADCLAEANIKI